MRFSVNMLTWNGEDFIYKALKSIAQYAIEIVVIDTGSTDSTIDILEQFKDECERFHYEIHDVQDLGETWKDDKKDIELTKLLNYAKSLTKNEWILKMDDDEIFPEETIKEILELEWSHLSYSIPFIHFEKDKILDPNLHKDLYVARLFRNIPEISWVNKYGSEVISYNGMRISSKANQKGNICKKIQNPFLHVGDLRKENRRHNYRFHTKGHCGLPIPKEYARYIA